MERMLRASEVAEILTVSKAYVYLLIARGQLPCLRLGNAKRVRQTDLETFISRNIYLAEMKLPREQESAKWVSV
jgi:excisionase family DNA binding protein